MTNKVYRVYIHPYAGQSELVVARNHTEMVSKVKRWIAKQNKGNTVDHWDELSDVETIGEITIE